MRMQGAAVQTEACQMCTHSGALSLRAFGFFFSPTPQDSPPLLVPFCFFFFCFFLHLALFFLSPFRISLFLLFIFFPPCLAHALAVAPLPLPLFWFHSRVFLSRVQVDQAVTTSAPVPASSHCEYSHVNYALLSPSPSLPTPLFLPTCVFVLGRLLFLFLSRLTNGARNNARKPRELGECGLTERNPPLSREAARGLEVFLESAVAAERGEGVWGARVEAVGRGFNLFGQEEYSSPRITPVFLTVMRCGLTGGRHLESLDCSLLFPGSYPLKVFSHIRLRFRK